MKVQMWEIGRVKPYENNPRKNDGAVAAVAGSIKEFGFRVPIVVDADGVIIAGHTRLKAAERLGLEQVPVHVAKELSPEKVRALRIADNQVASLSSWDYDLLPIELADLKSADFDLGLLGFSDQDLAAIMPPAAPVEDDVPDPPAEPVSRMGDLWLMGEHRVLVGDSTSETDVARLMAGAHADLLVTDPPYGVAYQTKLSLEEAVARRRRTDGLEVANDALGTEGTRELIRDALTLACQHLRPGAAFYVCSPSGDMSDVVRGAVAEAGLRYRQVLIWAKDVFVMGRQDYHWRHEDLLYGWKEGAAHYFVDDRTQDTVWEIPRPKRSEDHPTTKPVTLIHRAIANSSKRGELVLDVFLGSGTTLIAAEQAERRCYGIEIDPRYADVAVRRWEASPGEQAVLGADGRTFEAVERERSGRPVVPDQSGGDT